jgi:hypothetical protein
MSRRLYSPAQVSSCIMLSLNRDFHVDLLASCEDTPPCLPSSHASDIFPPACPRSLPRGLVLPLPCCPKRELPPLPSAPQTPLRSLTSVSTGYPCGHRPSYPAGTGSAASDTPRPARPRRLVHPGLDPGVYPPGWRVHDPVLQLTQHVQQLIVRHDDRGRRRLCHADAIPGLTPAGGDRSRA